MTPISTERLEIVLMTPAFFEACLAGDRAAAEALLGARLLDEWLEDRRIMEFWLQRLREDPAVQPWLGRGLVLREEGVMIGHAGFHTRPGPAYLAAIAPAGVELGYTIFTPYRRRGFAREAVAGLMAWAAGEHGVTSFVLSISVENERSLAIARHFGFVKVGSHIDEEDGPEDIFLLERPA